MDSGAEYLRYNLGSSRRDFCQLSVPTECETADFDAVLRWKQGKLSKLDDLFVTTYKHPQTQCFQGFTACSSNKPLISPCPFHRQFFLQHF